MLYSGISGEPVELGDQIGSGREGAVYRIIGLPCVAKIYHDPTPVDKIEAMTPLPNPSAKTSVKAPSSDFAEAT